MGIAGQNTFNVINCVNQVVNFVKNKKSKRELVDSGLCDNIILKLHHTYTFYFFTALYLVVFQQWYHKDMMTCSNKFNADLAIRPDYMNICYTYMFQPLEDGSRNYLFWYRYLQFVLLAIAGTYYWIHKVVKYTDDQCAKRVISEIQPIAGNGNIRQETDLDKVVYNRVPEYLNRTMGYNAAVYWKNLGLTFLALLIDLFTFYVFDYCLKGRFLHYLPEIIPFQRDTKGFTDYMSKTFPPFVECEINELYKLTSKRVETFGCHLPMMELYEKIFVFYWVWLMFLIAACCGYIIYMVFYFHPYFRFLLGRSYSTPSCGLDEDGRKIYDGLIRDYMNSLNVSDCYTLRRLKSHMSEVRYFNVILRMANRRRSLEESDSDYEKTKIGYGSNGDSEDDSTRRRNNMPKNMNHGMGMEGQNGNVPWMFDARRGHGPIRRS